jgi:phosphate/sulfate permease
MTQTGISRGQYIAAGALALAGLILSFAFLRFFPEFLKPAIAGALTGAFGILALQRLWPGLPLSKLHIIIGSIVAYGLLVGLVGRL